MSAAVTVRSGSGDDAAAIAEIWSSGWRDAHVGHVPDELVAVRTDESFRARASEGAGESLVAIVDGAVAGFVMVVDDEVEQFYVSSAHRGTGVADVLMREAEQAVRSNGHDEAWLAVVDGNARARRFYERAGWRDEGPFDYAAATKKGPIPVPCRRYAKQV